MVSRVGEGMVGGRVVEIVMMSLFREDTAGGVMIGIRGEYMIVVEEAEDMGRSRGTIVRMAEIKVKRRSR